MLPEQKTGNKLIIRDVGAYGAVMASNYNSRGLPAEILVNQEAFSIIHNATLLSCDSKLISCAKSEGKKCLNTHNLATSVWGSLA